MAVCVFDCVITSVSVCVKACVSVTLSISGLMDECISGSVSECVSVVTVSMCVSSWLCISIDVRLFECVRECVWLFCRSSKST